MSNIPIWEKRLRDAEETLRSKQNEKEVRKTVMQSIMSNNMTNNEQYNIALREELKTLDTEIIELRRQITVCLQSLQQAEIASALKQQLKAGTSD